MASSDQSTTIVNVTASIFVMLTLLLSAVTYVTWRDLKVAEADLNTMQQDLSSAEATIRNQISELDAIKEMGGWVHSDVGAPGEQNTVLGEMAEDLQTLGRDLQAQTVADTLTAMRTRIDQLETDLAAKESALQTEQDNMLALQQQYQEQINQIQQSQEGSETQLQQFITQREEVVQQKDEEINRLRNDYTRSQNELASVRDQMERMREDYDQQIAELVAFNTQLRTELDEIRRYSIEQPDGEIRRVDNSTRTVWINLGESDNLREQTTFSVYDEDHYGIARGPEDIKGRLEVVRILGPNLSQARILEEDLFRPMAEGDVVYSPVWSAGVVESFAFVGEIDFDRDGQSDRDQLHNLLHHAGAEIDVEVDDEGYRRPERGRITHDTKFLVLGQFPDPADYPSADPNRDRAERMLEVRSEMVDRAQRQGVRVLSLNEFLAFMGYKPTQRLFLPGETPYTLKAGEERRDLSERMNQNYSAGQTSELFRRQEDARGNLVRPGTRIYGK